MNQIEALNELYKSWQNGKNICYENGESLDIDFTEQQKRHMFLADGIVGITTDDWGLDLEFGENLLEVITQIHNKTTFKYVKDKNNYKKYIIYCNFIIDWIDWGVSIRGAWFDEGNKIKPNESFYNINGYNKNYFIISEDFMNDFIKFFKC